MSKKATNSEEGLIEIFTPYITVKGRRIYPKKSRFFHFFVKSQKSR